MLSKEEKQKQREQNLKPFEKYVPWIFGALLLVTGALFLGNNSGNSVANTANTSVTSSVSGIGFDESYPPTQEMKDSSLENFKYYMEQKGFAESSNPVKAIKNMNLDKADQKALIASVVDGSVKIFTVTVRDNMSEDGDVVQISSMGYQVNVPIFNAPKTFSFPAVIGQPVSFVGVTDGGGGITAEITTSSGPVLLPYLSVGQVVTVAVK